MWQTALNIRPGITTIIGSGGKTTLLRLLGRELSAKGHRVILCTTTKILPFSGIPTILLREQLDAALQTYGLVCTGTMLENGKLTAPPLPFADLALLADYVIVEGDGSNRLPLKAHLPHEPVIPAESQQTICIVGLSGLNRPIFQAAHRPERFAQLAGQDLHAPATAEAVAKVLKAEALADQYLLNQADIGCPDLARLQHALPQAMAVSFLDNRIYAK